MELPTVQYVPELIQLTTRDGLVHNELVRVDPKTCRFVRMLSSKYPYDFDTDAQPQNPTTLDDRRRIYKYTGDTVVKFFGGEPKRVRVFTEE